jgi:hypothetical protein
VRALVPNAAAAAITVAAALLGCAPSASSSRSSTPVILLPVAGADAAITVAQPTEVDASHSALRAPPHGPATIAWESSERAARDRARRLALPLLVYVRSSGSPGSLDMERVAWADPRVVAAVHRFVAFELDVSAVDGDAELAAQDYAIEALPTTLILDPTGHRIAAAAGSIDAERLLRLLREAQD